MWVEADDGVLINLARMDWIKLEAYGSEHALWAYQMGKDSVLVGTFSSREAAQHAYQRIRAGLTQGWPMITQRELHPV